MINIASLTATRNITDNLIEISFSIANTSENIVDYRFDLFRSSSNTDDYELIFSNILNFKCKDYSVNLYGEANYFYKIKIINKKTGNEKFSSSINSYASNEDEYTFSLNEMYSTYLDVVINNSEFKLLKRMRTGIQCDCYDDVRGSAYEGECLNCFGTGFKGGFYSPQNFKLCIMNAPVYQEQMANTGSFQSQTPLQAWSLREPLIQEGDMIIDTLNNTRFVVSNWQPSHKNGQIIRQTFQIVKVNESNFLFKLPV